MHQKYIAEHKSWKNKKHMIEFGFNSGEIWSKKVFVIKATNLI